MRADWNRLEGPKSSEYYRQKQDSAVQKDSKMKGKTVKIQKEYLCNSNLLQ